MYVANVTEREAAEIAENVKLREVLRKRDERIEYLEKRVEELDNIRDRILKRERTLGEALETRGRIIFELEEDRDGWMSEARLLKERVDDLEELVAVYRDVSGGIMMQLDEESERIRIRRDEEQFVVEDLQVVVVNNREEDSGDEADSEATTVAYVSAEE
jgi:hypothetical protein